MLRGTDDGIRRRLHLVPFEARIPSGKRDPYLKERLLRELPGILNWALEGCTSWQHDRLSPPLKVASATTNYLNEIDVLGRFLDEECVRGPGYDVPSSVLYTAFVEWCQMNGEDVDTQKAFSMRMQEKGVENKRTSACILWLEIDLKANRQPSV
jgi:putative DNA primase/helicase